LHAGGVFQTHNWDVHAIDAIQNKLSEDEVLNTATTLAPHAIFCLVGAISAEEDRQFIRRLKTALPNTTLIGCGDILLQNGEKWLAEGELDAIALDFTSEAPVKYAEGNYTDLKGLLYKVENKVFASEPLATKTVSVGVPPHHLFSKNNYRFPFAQKTPFASLLVDYGCPFNCSFCVMSGLNYHRRPMDEVAKEIELLKSMGIKEFILWDQTFAAKREWALEFLALLPTGDEKFGWTCYTRPDKIDRDLAMEMSKRGCHTAIMGIETANDDTLKMLQKGFTTTDTVRAFSVCREAEITTVATAIVGLPGETEKDVLRSIDFVCEVDPDYLSVHTAVPRSGTKLRESMEKQGLVSQDLETMDQCGENSVLASDSLSAEQIKSLHRKFTLRFYLRPRFLVRTTLRLLRNPKQLMDHIRQGLILIRKNKSA